MPSATNPSPVVRDEYKVHEHVPGMCEPFPWAFAYANGHAPEGKKSAEAKKRALRLRHLFPAVHRPSGQYTFLARLASDPNGHYYQPRNEILRTVFTNERPEHRSKKIPGSTGMPDDNRVSVVDSKTGKSVTICYWPDAYVEWRARTIRRRQKTATSPRPPPAKAKTAAEPPKPAKKSARKKRSRADRDRETAREKAQRVAEPVPPAATKRMTVAASAPNELVDAREDPEHAGDFVQGVTLAEDTPVRPRKRRRHRSDDNDDEQQPQMNRLTVLRKARNDRYRHPTQTPAPTRHTVQADDGTEDATVTEWMEEVANWHLDGDLQEADPELHVIASVKSVMYQRMSYHKFRHLISTTYGLWPVQKHITHLVKNQREQFDADAELVSEEDDVTAGTATPHHQEDDVDDAQDPSVASSRGDEDEEDEEDEEENMTDQDVLDLLESNDDEKEGDDDDDDDDDEKEGADDEKEGGDDEKEGDASSSDSVDVFDAMFD